MYDYGGQYLLTNNWSSLDVRVIWVTVSTTADTDRTAQYVGDIGTLSEYDGSGYPSAFANRYAIGTETKVLDTTDHDIKLTTTEGVLNKTTIGATPGSEPQVTGYVIYVQGTSDADSPLLAYIDLAAAGVGEAFTPSGGAVNTTWDAEGIIKFVFTAA